MLLTVQTFIELHHILVSEMVMDRFFKKYGKKGSSLCLSIHKTHTSQLSWYEFTQDSTRRIRSRLMMDALGSRRIKRAKYKKKKRRSKDETTSFESLTNPNVKRHQETGQADLHPGMRNSLCGRSNNNNRGQGPR